MVAFFMRALALLLLLSLGGCRCTGGVEGVEPAVGASPRELEFGRVLEGTKVTQLITVVAESRVEVTVTAKTSAPFSTAAKVVVPGGSQVDFPVVFTAGNGEATGSLVLASGTKSITVPLHGIGVRPLNCMASGPCMRSTFSLELNQCVETTAPEGVACDPGSLCLEQGRCKAGQCLGISRKCDDNDACTLDGCSNATGCVHTPVTCPRPANACRRATCDPATGCGDAKSPDGDPCGPANCTNTQVCSMGACGVIKTPEGTPCGAEIACMPMGECHNTNCVRPDAGDWRPSWSTELPGLPASDAPAMLGNGSALFFPLCGVPLEDGGQDTEDGGRCALYSWTASGFDRFSAPLTQALQLVQVSPRGVLLHRDGGLELRSIGTGQLVDSLGFSVPLDAIAFAEDAAIILALDDGRVQSWATDASVSTVGQFAEGGVIVLDENGGVFSWTGSGLLNHLAFTGDGGARLSSVAIDAGERSLTVSGNRAVLGRWTSVAVDPDMGVFITPLAQSPDEQTLVPRSTLQTDSAVSFFMRRCPTPLVQCAAAERLSWVSLNDVETGARLWEAEVVGQGFDERLVEPALFDVMSDGGPALGVGALSEVSSGSGSRLLFQLFVDGHRVLACPLAPRAARASGAVFQGHQLFVLAARPDGGAALESYDLKALPLHRVGWSAPSGQQGWRR